MQLSVFSFHFRQALQLLVRELLQRSSSFAALLPRNSITYLGITCWFHEFQIHWLAGLPSVETDAGMHWYCMSSSSSSGFAGTLHLDGLDRDGVLSYFQGYVPARPHCQKSVLFTTLFSTLSRHFLDTWFFDTFFWHLLVEKWGVLKLTTFRHCFRQ